MQKSKKSSQTKAKKVRNTFKKRVLTLFSRIKNGKYTQRAPRKLPVYNEKGELAAFLCPLNQKTLSNQKEINLLFKWRKENSFAFPSQFTVTKEGTKRWVENQLLKNHTRILFFIEDAAEKPKLIGHIGLYSFDFREHSCEIDNVVRGDKNHLKGAMTWALTALIQWTQRELGPKNIFLRVFSDNTHAVTFYKRCGFMCEKLIPLKKMVKPHMVVWEEDESLMKANKYFQKMVLKSET